MEYRIQRYEKTDKQQTSFNNQIFETNQLRNSIKKHPGQKMKLSKTFMHHFFFMMSSKRYSKSILIVLPINKIQGNRNT